jgi:diguanylate cyclase (GGDEF)-like protein
MQVSIHTTELHLSTGLEHPSALLVGGEVKVDVIAAAPALLDAVPDAILVVGSELTITYLNSAAQTAFGKGDQATYAGASGIDLIHPDDRERILGKLALILDVPGKSVGVEFRVNDYENSNTWKPIQATAINQMEHPSIRGIVVSFRDLRREQHHASSAMLLGEALERTSDLMMLHAEDGTVMHANSAARQFLGEECLLFPWPYPDHMTEILKTQIIPWAKNHGAWNGELEMLDQFQRTHTLSVVITCDAAGSSVITARDVTEQKRAEVELQHRASHDTLTDLPNRAALLDHLEKLTSKNRNNRRLAVLFIDLDRFKLVNDSLGHAFGDELLMEVASRFRTAIGESDLLARLGGDEFVAVILDEYSEMPMDRLVAGVSDRLHRVLKTPINLGGRSVYVSASVGVAVQDGSTSASDLLRQADLAMFRAKASGRSRTERFAASMAIDAERGLAIESELHEALTNNELFVAYQPILSMNSQLLGFEALVRWNRDGEIVEPSGFLSVAQESNLITQIDEFVLCSATKQLANWTRIFPEADRLTVSVNLSARQLARPDLVEIVRLALTRSEIEPSRLILEITEGNLMTDIRATIAALEGLRGLGIRLAIDDFGTGYSSLSYLQRFNAHSVKIDRSFVEFSDSDESDARIVEAIVGLARTFGMTTVAEGVETAAQFDRIRALGCDAVQGYLLGRAVDAVEATTFVRTSFAKELMATSADRRP